MYQMEDVNPEEFDDNEYMTNNLIETITLLCRNNLKYNYELKIQGLLAVTTDNQNIMLVQINEVLPKKGPHVASHFGSGNSMMETNPAPQPMGPTGSVPMASGMSRGLSRGMLGRGRMARRGGMPHRSGMASTMRAPTLLQSPMAARARVRQQLQFTTPQKRPAPSQSLMMRSPGGAMIRTPRHSKPLHSPQNQQVECSNTRDVDPYEVPVDPIARRTPSKRIKRFQPKSEPIESDETSQETRQTFPVKKEYVGIQLSSDVCVLSDEEDYNPPQLKSEIEQSPTRKRRMPVLSCEVDGESSSAPHEALNKVSGTEKGGEGHSLRMEVKSESVPSIRIESVKDEGDWSSNNQWQGSSSQQQHHCSQCGSLFHNIRGLRQHVRTAHPSSTEDANVVATLVDDVITSSSYSRRDDELEEVV